MTIASVATSIWDDFVGFWENDVWPGLKSLFQLTVSNEVKALTPIATQVVSTVASELGSVTSLSAGATIVGNALASVAKAAEDAGISAGVASLVTVVTSAVGNVLGTAPAATTPAPVATTPTV